MMAPGSKTWGFLVDIYISNKMPIDEICGGGGGDDRVSDFN